MPNMRMGALYVATVSEKTKQLKRLGYVRWNAKRELLRQFCSRLPRDPAALLSALGYQIPDPRPGTSCHTLRAPSIWLPTLSLILSLTRAYPFPR